MCEKFFYNFFSYTFWLILLRTLVKILDQAMNAKNLITNKFKKFK